MRQLLGILLVGAMLLGAISCGDSETVVPNQAPTVAFVFRPEQGAAVGDNTRFAWTGSDPDGSVAEYQFSLDGDTLSATQDTSITLNFEREDGTDSNPIAHTFRVRAVDEEGLAGAYLTAEFLVTVFNKPPSVGFTDRPAAEGYIGDMARLAWEGADDDGAIDHFEFVIDDTTGAWTSTPDTTVTIDFSGGTPQFAGTALTAAPLNNPIDYVFFLRSVDNEGKRSFTIQTGFLAGPLNIPPVVALLAAPPEPPGVIGAQGTWVWEASDTDGFVDRVQYAVDRMGTGPWTRWDADTLHLRFTRAQGKEEDPTLHTFSLRAQDDDADYSQELIREFLVGVQNTPPTVRFLSEPPDNPVSHRFSYSWTATDDDPGVVFEYAVDDSVDDGEPAWTATAATQVPVNFPATGIDSSSCGPTGCNSFGAHTLYLRAVDALGVYSATISSDIQTFTRTPFTVISQPAPDGEGVVPGGDSLVVRWVGSDIDDVGFPLIYEILVREVDEFASHPDAGDAATEPGLTWMVLGVDVTETTVELDPARNYIVALRATDVAGAREAYFEYGRNTIKVAAP